MLSRHLLLSIILLFIPFSASAIPAIKHTPPEFEMNKELNLAISGDGIVRARVLISDIDGIRVKRMSQDGDRFVTSTEFFNLAILKYQFQVEFANNQLFLSEYYYIRQPSNEELETKISALSNELNTVQTSIRRLENGLSNLKSIDNSVFQQKRAEELGKALITLRKMEKDKDEFANAAESNQKAWLISLTKEPRGKFVSALRTESEAENESLWGKIK